MIILGIDPGTTIIGYSILEIIKNNINLLDYGCIKTDNSSEEEKLIQIGEDIKIILNKWEIEKASIEDLFFTNNAKTAIKVAQARGVIMYEIAKKGIEIHSFTPPQIKSAICGYGKADKKMVQKMLKTILNLKEIPKQDDSADAIAAGICLANSIKMKLIK